MSGTHLSFLLVLFFCFSLFPASKRDEKKAKTKKEGVSIGVGAQVCE
jgi:preprotein translocase subunit YajC